MLVLAVGATLPVGPLPAEEFLVAVAANFRDTAVEIAQEFNEQTGHRMASSYGSTGQLFAQIVQGAPFDVFLAADRDRPREAVEAGAAVAGSRITYAIGRIVLVGTEVASPVGPDVLRHRQFERLAIAEPRTAPYGRAAMETLRALGLMDSISDRIVRGQSVTHAYHLVRSGNAELGFVALAQARVAAQGAYWTVPDELHAPIRQDAVLLEHGADSEAAKSFMAFLQSSVARVILARHGYSWPQ